MDSKETFEKMCKAAGTTGRQLLEEIRANRLKLESCKLHDFSVDVTPDQPFNKRFQCTHCGGHVSINEKIYYELGLKHAQNNITTDAPAKP